MFADLTVDENLDIVYKRRGDWSRKRVYDVFPALSEIKSRRAGFLSGGEQQMLAIGRALMANPKMVLMDEPSLGLSPLLVKEIFHIIRMLNEEEKTTILLVEQNANMALSACHYGYIMENGRVVLDGPGKQLKENDDVREFYLGMAGHKSFREVKHYRRRKRWLS